MSELEVWYKVFEKHGDCFEIRPDQDGLGLVEVVSRDESGKETQRMVMTTESAALVGTALRKISEQLDDQS